jgi:regulator of PEP synthase PpsR (kinase-PPPase family)
MPAWSASREVTELMKRTAFFISDSTGITAEALGSSLLAQFEGLRFERVILPYTDTADKARSAAEKIDRIAERDGIPPIIFDTIVNAEVRDIIKKSAGFTVDILSTFLSPLEEALGIKSSFTVGGAHSVSSEPNYKHRIDAVNYALDNDDGAKVDRYSQAELILIGVSRSGKTPTSLYLALQTGVFVANYPLTDDDLDTGRLPKPLVEYRNRLYGLTIEPGRLATIRTERRANARYSTLSQCEYEVRQAEQLFKRFGIPCIDSTHASIEEIATRVLADTGLRGHSK